MDNIAMIFEPIGGLGNQFFQIVALLVFSKKYKKKNVYDPHKLISKGYTNSPTYYDSIFSCLQQYKKKINNDYEVFNVKQFEFKNLQSSKSFTILNGMFMNVQYFWNDINYIQSILNPIQKISPHYDIIKNFVDSNSNNICVCIGFRRFTEEKREKDWALDLNYYKKAWSLLYHDIKDLNKKIVVLLISDNPIYVEQNINNIIDQSSNIEMIHIKGGRNGNDDVIQYYHMTHCSHFILCNSTFHLTACYLSTNLKQVIYPDSVTWFKHLIPKNDNRFIAC